MPDQSALTRLVRSLPDEFLLRREVAADLALSVETVRTLPRRFPGNELGPSHAINWGDQRISLYSPERLAHIRGFLAARARFHEDGRPMRRGRHALWSPTEALSRRQRAGLANYYRSRASVLKARGDEAGADAARIRSKSIQTELKDEEKARRKSLARLAAKPDAGITLGGDECGPGTDH